MSVAEELLELSHEFYSTVTPWERERNPGLNLLFRKVVANIKNGLEGFDERQELLLVKETIGDLKELMGQVNDRERRNNPKLKKCFESIREQMSVLLEEMSSYVSEECDCGLLWNVCSCNPVADYPSEEVEFEDEEEDEGEEEDGEHDGDESEEEVPCEY